MVTVNQGSYETASPNRNLVKDFKFIFKIWIIIIRKKIEKPPIPICSIGYLKLYSNVL